MEHLELLEVSSNLLGFLKGVWNLLLATVALKFCAVAP